MYRFLVVEDDNNIRAGLIKIISKMDLPIENIYEADNGRDAINSIAQFNPHIIITDIKMPLMSGLDFIEHLKSTGSNAKFVILSGYSEFSFAQRAISCNVSEYLLKPVKKDKLYSTLSRIITQLKQEEEECSQRLENSKKMKEYYYVILKEILEGYHNPNEINFIISNTDITFHKEGFTVLCILCRSKDTIIMDFMDKHADQLNICYHWYASNQNNIICLINIDLDEYAKILLLLKEYTSAFHIESKERIYSGVSEWTDSTASLPEMVKQARNALDFRLLDRPTQVFLYPELQKRYIHLKPTLNTYFEEILNSVNNQNPQELYLSIDHLFDFLLKLNPITPALIKSSIENFIHYYLPPDKKRLLINSMNTQDLYQASDSMADFRMNIKQMFYNICKFEKDYSVKNYNNKISTAIKYIEKNYSNNLSLEEVAKYINMNTSYFSNSFKKETGVHFSDFLQKIRVEKSKGLLIQPQHKIYEIAEKVGFMDEKYYFKIFKKLTGLTPNQYRNGVPLDKVQTSERES